MGRKGHTRSVSMVPIRKGNNSINPLPRSPSISFYGSYKEGKLFYNEPLTDEDKGFYGSYKEGKLNIIIIQSYKQQCFYGSYKEGKLVKFDTAVPDWRKFLWFL